MTPEERWTAALDARAIPQAIVAAAPESPWGFPAELFRSRAEAVANRPTPTPTTLRALEALPQSGTVLDVGAGGGATSLPLANVAGTLVGFDQQPDMLTVFEEAAGARTESIAILGSWPRDHESAPVADIVVSGHTVYNVADLAPFVRALASHARTRVVLEATERHPLGWMADLWRLFHGIEIRDAPTIDLAIEVLRSIGIRPMREDRPATDEDPSSGGLASKQAAVTLMRKRLCLPADRDPELEAALGERLRQRNGSWTAGPADREIVTLWWDVEAA